MNKIMLAFIGCMLFGGIQIKASGGGGGAAKQGDKEEFIRNLFLPLEQKTDLNKIFDGKIDEVITRLTNMTPRAKGKDVKALLDVLLGHDISNTGLIKELQVEAVQKLWNADKSAMTGEDILSTAIENGHKSIVKFMMSQASGWTYSVEKWAENFPEYPTATHFAIKKSALVSMLQLLNTQDLLVRNAQGDTPLHIEFEKISNAFYVTFNKNKALCLIEKMASQGQNSEHFSMVNGKGDSLLHLALERSHDKSLVDKLLDYGVETDQINSQGLSPLILAARLSIKGIDGIKGWKIEDKQQVFDDLLEKAANLEVFGVGQNNILFDPFVLGNFENFKKVVDRINTLCAEQQIACADWIAQQQKDGSVILEFLVNFDQDSCLAGKARGLPDYSSHVNYLWNARAVNQEMLHRASVVAPIKNVLKGKYTNEKMVEKLEKMRFLVPSNLEEMIAEIQRQQLAESDAEAARIEAARVAEAQRVAQQAAEQAAEQAAAQQAAEVARRVEQERQAAEQQAAEAARAHAEAQAAEAARVAAEKDAAIKIQSVVRGNAARVAAAEAARVAEAQRLAAARVEAAQQAAEAARKFEQKRTDFINNIDQQQAECTRNARIKQFVAFVAAMSVFAAAVKYRHVLPAFGKKMLGYCGNFVRNLTAQAKTPLLTSAVAQ